MAIAEILNKFMAQKSVDYELIAHSHTGSSHETALASHVREDHIAKAVIVRDFSGYAMVVVPATHHVELKHVCRELDREFEFVDEDDDGHRHDKGQQDEDVVAHACQEGCHIIELLDPRRCRRRS